MADFDPRQCIGKGSSMRILAHLDGVSFNYGASGLTTRKGSRARVLEQVTLTIRQGDSLGLIGRNGSGKTTLLRIVAGFLKPTSGTFQMFGTVKGLVDPGVVLDVELSGRTNAYSLLLMAGKSPREARGLLDEIQQTSGLKLAFDVPVKTYSTGMASRLIFSTAVEGSPDLLVLDEGIGAVDEEFQGTVEERMSKLVHRSGALLLASHSHDLIRRYCERCVWLDQGRVVSVGPTAVVLGEYGKAARGAKAD